MKKQKADERISVVVVSTPAEIRGDGHAYVSEISLKKLHGSFTKLRSAMSDVLAEGAAKLGAFELQEVQLAVEITASGEFRLLGSGVSVEGKGGVTLTFRKSPVSSTS